MLQARTATLNGDLSKQFEQWYPGLQINRKSEKSQLTFKKTEP